MNAAARYALLAGIVGAVLCAAPVAGADTAAETALAERYAPVVRLVDQPEECGRASPTSRPTWTSSSTSPPLRSAGRGTGRIS